MPDRTRQAGQVKLLAGQRRILAAVWTAQQLCVGVGAIGGELCLREEQIGEFLNVQLLL